VQTTESELRGLIQDNQHQQFMLNEEQAKLQYKASQLEQ